MVLSLFQGQIDSLQSYENKYGSVEVWKCEECLGVFQKNSNKI